MALVCVATGLTLGGCSHSRPRAPGEPEVILASRAGPQHVKVELARTEPERERGLMFRQSLASGRGMLFIFEHPQRLTFWMKNTYIPLDMIFMDAKRRVVYVEQNAEPLTLSPRGPQRDSMYVLEVPGGWALAHGVEPGTQVEFVNID